jgi:PAS domain S-box-containing protein
MTPKSLSKKAEQFLNTNPEKGNEFSSYNVSELVRELHTYQIELEMQNDELQKSIQETRDSNDKYKELYEFAPIGYLTLNSKKIILEANLMASTLLGVGTKHLLGECITTLIQPADQSKAQRHYLQALKSKSNQSDIFQVSHNPPGALFIQCETLAVFSSAKIHSFKTIIKEITELKSIRMKQEMAILETNSRSQELQVAFDSVLDGLITISDVGIIESLNTAAENIFSYSKNELVGQNIKLLMPEPYKSAHDSYLKNYLKTGKKNILKVSQELVGLKKDGLEFPIALSVNEMFLNGTRKYIGTVRDNTQLKEDQKLLESYAKNLEKMARKRAHELENSYLKTNSYFQMPLVGVLVSNPKKGITEANERICEMLGYSNKELLELTWEDITHPEDLKKDNELFSKVYSGELERYSLEKKYFKKNRDIINVEISVGCVRNARGTPDYFVAMIQDITDRKLLESQKEKLGRDKSNYLSMAAHELRTPLTTIQGFSEILMTKKDLSSTQKNQYLSYIHEESEQLSDIINDLLSISRIESGKGFTLFKTTNNTMSTILDIMRIHEKLSRKHIFKLNCPNKNATWDVDRRKVGEIFHNLYSNAVKYSPDGGTIETDIICDNYFTIVRISDQGMGMTPKELKSTFDKFYRGDKVNSAITGTGLGMGIVKNLVEAHAGKILVTSEHGKWTCVTIKIPNIMK